jgi:hypothetical protein
MRANEILISAESGFRQRVCHALRPAGSFGAAPAVTGVSCPGGARRTFGVLVAHVGHHGRLPAVAAAGRFAAAVGVRPGCSAGAMMGHDFACQ